MSHILVVDDSPIDRQLAGHLLQAGLPLQVEYASNGIEALESIEASLPLAVVTDLQMPEMGGMELIEALRRQYVTLPIVVMTGHGSEDDALAALLSGAADYVPKSQLSSELVKAVEAVLTLVPIDRPRERLSHCLRHEQLRYELNNDILLIPPLVVRLQQAVLDLQIIEPADRVRFGKALAEALLNAVLHGNLKAPREAVDRSARDASAVHEWTLARQQQIPYAQRSVTIEAEFTGQLVRVTVRDSGQGFDLRRLPDVKTNPEHLVSGAGRGLVLIQTFMDEVSFNAAGNEITMIKQARHRY